MTKVRTLPILAGFLIALAGCGRDRTAHRNADPGATAVGVQGQASPAATSATVTDRTAPTSKPPKVDSRPVLTCFGDSLTAGLGTDAGQSYPDYLQSDLDKLHYRYRVDNQGVSGNTSKDGVERLPEIVAAHPVLVVVEFGGNDGLRGLPMEDTLANLDEIVRTLKRAGIKVVLAGITLPPDYGPDYVSKFNENYQLLAKKYKVPMLPFLLKGVYGVPGMMQGDRTHATAKGNAIVARNVLALVAPLLRR